MQGFNPKETMLRSPIDRGGGKEHETDPTLPILRFSAGHSDILRKILEPYEEKIKTKTPGYPSFYMENIEASIKKIERFTFKFPAEDLKNIVLAASEGLPTTAITERKTQFLNPQQLEGLPHRKKPASNELLGSIADVIEQELGNTPIVAIKEMVGEDPAYMQLEHTKHAITQRLQLLHGLRELDALLQQEGYNLGLSERSEELIDLDEEIIAELTQTVEAPTLPALGEGAPFPVDPQTLRAIESARMELLFQVTNPSGPQRLTRDSLRAEIERQKQEEERLRAIAEAQTAPMPSVRQPGEQHPDPGATDPRGRRGNNS